MENLIFYKIDKYIYKYDNNIKNGKFRKNKFNIRPYVFR